MYKRRDNKIKRIYLWTVSDLISEICWDYEWNESKEKKLESDVIPEQDKEEKAQT